MSTWEVVAQVSDPPGWGAGPVLLAPLWTGLSAWPPEAGAPHWAVLEAGALIVSQSHAERGFVSTSPHGLICLFQCPLPAAQCPGGGRTVRQGCPVCGGV